MRFETYEERIVFAQSLGPALDLDLNIAPTAAVSPAVLSSDIHFRSTDDDFRYASKDLNTAALDALLAATEQWSQDPTAVGLYEIKENSYLEKRTGHYPPTVTADGVLVAQRFANNTNDHTMIVVKREESACFHTGGSYTHQDYHYLISFDVRHPLTELSWLTDHAWGIVMQLWGPRESGETPRNPPFAIYSQSLKGVPYWTVKSYGDSRLTTQTGDYEQVHVVQVPMQHIGEWQHFDVEFVPNPFGEGLIRTWLDGELLAEWKDIQNTYYSVFNGEPTGPLNPAFGLYGSMDEDGMEVHLDNLSVQCDGLFQSSIAGTVRGTSPSAASVVYATNQVTGQRLGTQLQSSGVYTLAVPPGVYAVTAVNQATGEQFVIQDVNTTTTSQLVNFDVAPRKTVTLTGDVTGDGKSEIINRLDNGTWQVSVATTDGRYTTSTWGGWSTKVDWLNVQLADVNGDGRQDIVGRVTDGNWWVAESTGTQFINRHFGKWSSSVRWTDVSVGDFNGDGLSDIAGRETSRGTWWVSSSTGTRFNTAYWGQWSTAVNWIHPVIGDFNGDGRSDLAAQVDAQGSWWVALSTGTSFQNRQWGAWSKFITWRDVLVGDFNGDGKSDIVGRTYDGNWWVARSDGQRFWNEHWGRWGTAVQWYDVQVGDVDGDGNSDLMGRASFGNTWWVAKSNGARFLNYFWGAVWAADEDWLAVHVNDFDGDGKSDLLGATATRWQLNL